MKFLAALAAALIVSIASASAHDTSRGPHGGVMADAGQRYHAELLVNGSPDITVFLMDKNDRPVSSQGYRANAILVVNGAAQRFVLQAGDDNRLVGTAPVPVPIGVKGVVQFTAPDGTTSQARF